MPDDALQQTRGRPPPEPLKQGPLKTRVKDAFEATTGMGFLSIRDDTKIEKTHLRPILDWLSKSTGRRIWLPEQAPSTILTLTSYIYKNQAQFEPLPEEQQMPND